jgi:hypothetical protein
MKASKINMENFKCIDNIARIAGLQAYIRDDGYSLWRPNDTEGKIFLTAEKAMSYIYAYIDGKNDAK